MYVYNKRVHVSCIVHVLYTLCGLMTFTGYDEAVCDFERVLSIVARLWR